MKKVNTLGIIQARMGSKRLPGKVLATIDGRPMLEILIKRLKRCKSIDLLVVATTTNEEDDQIADLAASSGVKCYRGEEDDVLSRFIGALRDFPTRTVVRITADNPLTDPHLVDRLVAEHVKNNADYTVSRGFPVGTGAEVVDANVLAKVGDLARDIAVREHVTLYIVNNPSQFTIHSVKRSHATEASVTVDTQRDLDFVRRLVSAMGNPDDISIEDVVRFWEQERDRK